MTTAGSQLTEKIAEVYAELKRTALWKTDAPEWVQHYQTQPATEVAFTEWLQFVFLPNKSRGNGCVHLENIAPQAARFYGNEITKGNLLQLLVELDSITG